MNYTTIKNAAEIQLQGISVELEKRDGSNHAIVLRDANGGFLKITASYGISVLGPAAPKMVKKFRLSGKFAGLVDVLEDFDSEYDAKAKLDEFKHQHRGDDSEVGLKIEQVEVPEEA
jgi:hypothetical protein